MKYTCPKTISVSAARGFGRKAARADDRDDAGRHLKRDLKACPAIRPHAEQYIHAYWDEKLEISFPEFKELIDR